MKNKSYFIHLSLMIVLSVALISITLVHTFLPQFLILLTDPQSLQRLIVET